MKMFDPSSAVCQVFTYKEGLLSAFAYDLRINVTAFIIELGGEEHFINARFDAQSLRVDCAMVGGLERPDLLSAKDKEEIDRSIIREVLETDKYKEIFLISSAVTKESSDYLIKGFLTLHGDTRDISFKVRTMGHYHTADVWLLLTDFGIKPFSALFGAIRVKPDILIRVMIPKQAEFDPFSQE